jgi:hypothetical protein
MKKNRGCRVCKRKNTPNGRKYTAKDVKRIVEEDLKHLNLKYVDDKYVDSSTPFLVQCLFCDHKFKTIISNIRRQKYGCARCGRGGYTTNDIKKIVEEDFKHLNLKYMNDEYINRKTAFSVKCLLCNSEFKTYINSIKAGYACVKCCTGKPYKIRKYTTEQVKNKIEIEFKYLNLKYLNDEYVNWRTQFSVKCLTCDYEFKTTLGIINGGSKCPRCARKQGGEKIKYKFDEVKEIVESYNLELISTEYIGSYEPMEIKCKIGHIFFKSLSCIAQGCTICNASIMEEMCRKYFEYLFDFPFEKAHPMWLTNNETGRRLELDGFNEALKIAFEYNGQQHYTSRVYFDKSEEDFIQRQKRDLLKQELCDANNVKLIIIPYTVKVNDLFTYIKEECVKQNIPFDQKEDKSPTEMNVYNNKIIEINKAIDEMLIESRFKRVSNFIGARSNVTIECTRCKSQRNVMYDNLRRRSISKCEYCDKIETRNKIDQLLKDSYITVSEYVSGEEFIDLKCLVCNSISKEIPKNIFGRKKIMDCATCNIKVLSYNKKIDDCLIRFNFKRISNYITARKKILVECNECKFQIHLKYFNIIHRSHSPKCNCKK